MIVFSSVRFDSFFLYKYRPPISRRRRQNDREQSGPVARSNSGFQAVIASAIMTGMDALEPKRPCFYPTPAWLVLGLLPVTGFLFLTIPSS